MKRKKLGQILLEAGAITRQQLHEALEDQKRYGGKLGNILLDRRMISEKEFFHALTSQLQIPAVDFTRSTIPENVIKLVTEDLAQKYVVFPVALKPTPKGKVLVLAMADPTNVAIQDEIQFTTGYKVEPALSLDSTLRYVIRDYFFDRNGQGSYRLEMDFDLGTSKIDSINPAIEGEGTDVQAGNGFTIHHERQAEGDMSGSGPASPENSRSRPANKTGQRGRSAPEKPKLSRELKALLKLLAKKGIITPQEYLEEFNNTE